MISIVRRYKGAEHERRLGDLAEVERTGRTWVFRALAKAPKLAIAREVFALILASKSGILGSDSKSATYVLTPPKSVPVTKINDREYECRGLRLVFLTDETGEVRVAHAQGRGQEG